MTEERPRVPTRAYWHGKRVLLTGHTGFKGSWLAAWLQELGAETAGLSLPEPVTDPALWDSLGVDLALDLRADICSESWKGAVADFDPQVVLHLAAQPLVSEGFAAPYRTFATNVLGTANLLDTVPSLASVEAVLVATTDKVYDSTGPTPYDERSRLGGKDPYSASKVGAELVVGSWPAVGCPVVTARAGNVIGGGDWGSNRLVPDLVRGWSAGATVELRHPDATRPWQHVLEPLSGYLVYVEALAAKPSLPRTMNFGPSAQQAVSVREVVDLAAREWATSFEVPTPASVVRPKPSMVETEALTIDSVQATEVLGWRSRLDWQAAVSMAVDWYVQFRRGADASAVLLEQLRAYACLATEDVDEHR
ncbi:MAG: CDP-glucose 4,6-dehydratase [Nocardioidaceae bacterium]|nr:CDP-glucose 4,6-dehydratase [Nocardioidaceae bacterium]